MPSLLWAALFALGLLVLLLQSPILGPASASAHANLLRSEPPADAKLPQPPTELRLYFTQALTQRGSYVQVKDSSEREIPVQVAFDPADAKLMKAALPALVPGMYSVKWQSLSADDDDYADGVYQFTVLNPDGTDPGSENAIGSSRGGSDRALLLAAGAGIFAIALAAGSVVALKRRRGQPY